MRYGSAGRLGPHAIGRRVTVRYRIPDGMATDVVGILVEWGDETCTVRARGGRTVTVRIATIIASRIVPGPS